MRENWSVLGIGVAVIVSVSTSARIFRIFSFTATPNFCSSSMISSPRSLNFTPFPASEWVPISMSIFPSARSFSSCVRSFPCRAALR